MSHFLHRPGLPLKENGAPTRRHLARTPREGWEGVVRRVASPLLADRRHHTHFGRLLDASLYSERGISYQLAQPVHAEQDPAVPR